MIPALLTILLCVLTLSYFFILIFLIRGLAYLPEGNNLSCPFVSVVVAARNEESNIGACLEALSAQDYPKDSYEIIAVNDRSEDRTDEIIDRYAMKISGISAIHIKNKSADMAPKKWALHQGIQKARGEIILTTDADCVPSPQWVSSMIRYFEPGVGLVAGYSPLTGRTSGSLFEKLVALDGLALAAVAAGSIGAGMPLTCNGRNLAYRKAVYNEVGGFQSIGHYISGDDDLFLHLVKKQTDYQIRYATDTVSQVPSFPPRTIKAFFNQRTRHASKGKHYHRALKYGLIILYFYNVLFCVGLFLMNSWPAWIACYGFKSTGEFLFLSNAASLFRKERLLLIFPLAVFLHIPYVVFFGLWGQIGRFTWKSDTYSPVIKSE